VRATGQERIRTGAGPGPAIWVEDKLSFLHKIRNRARVRKGRAKQKIGRATNNPLLQAEGMADRVSGGIRQFGEVLKDAGRDVRRAFHR
jgi:uncharacterized protein YjbJ (UPF0337 family)